MAEAVMVLLLLGLTAYVVLGGADFGAGLWYMLLPGERRRGLRDHTYHAMGPVWEANHVWLIFVFVVAWTAFPRAFGSIASTLYIPLFVAAVGIILRGATYALRGWAEARGEERVVGAIFGVSSLLTPFALGAAIGGIASERVPVGNAAGDPWSSWLNGTSVLIGILAVVSSAYLAAVWLTADAARADRDDLVYHSVIPWVSFTSISHARDSRRQSGIPKVTFGKYREAGGRVLMPVSVEVHHALMDGLHVGRFFERLEGYFKDPGAALGL
jgi:cytochrome d ubiquinol oxidase subunit II